MRHADRFRVAPGTKISLAKIDAGAVHGEKEPANAETEAHAKRLAELQYLIYAEHARSVLIVLQAPDAGGKDGTIKHVLAAMNPQGTRVHVFGVPSREENAHDFLWRAHVHAPARGEVVVFNRSHYEGVLVERVHGLVPKKVWSKRYDRINEFEKNLAESGTHVFKFYLHIDKREQLDRFGKRLEDRTRWWKISESDYDDRKRWTAFAHAYEEAIEKTSTPWAPWFVIPANHKWFRDLAVSRILVESLGALDMKLPKPAVDIAAIRRKYHAAARAR